MLSFNNRSARLETPFLHAAAVKTDQGALLIMGHSGAGKSTLSRLLIPVFPKIADDVVELVLEDACWMVSNAQRPAGHLAEKIQLRGFIRIFQAPRCELVPISARKCCFHLTDALFEVPSQRLADHDQQCDLFVTVAALARTNPGWEVHFTPDQAVVDLFDQHFQNAESVIRIHS